MSTTVPQFTPGELVNLSIKGARVEEVNEGYARFSYGTCSATNLNTNAAGVTVERVAPKEWPPLAGDIWVDRNKAKWMASGGSVSGVVALISAHDRNGHWADPAELAAEVGPMTLTYRDGWTPTPEATDDEPAKADEAESDKNTARRAGLRAFVDFLEAHPRLRFDYTSNIVVVPSGVAAVQDWADALGVDAEVEVLAAGDTRHLAKRDFGPFEVCVTQTAYAPRRKPYEWLAEFHPGVRILDADGWTGHDFEARVTREVFEERLSQCTITGPVYVPVLGDNVDDPADTGARTGCECSDCEDIEAGQIDAADADQTTSDAEQVLATVAEPDVTRCPDCGSRDPRLHPATQAEGEVTRLCHNAFHGLTAEVTA